MLPMMKTLFTISGENIKSVRVKYETIAKFCQKRIPRSVLLENRTCENRRFRMCGRTFPRRSARRRSGKFRGVNIANGEPRASSSLPLHRAEIDRINSGSELAPSSWKTSPSRLSSSTPRATIIGAISFPPSTPTSLCRLSSPDPLRSPLLIDEHSRLLVLLSRQCSS